MKLVYIFCISLIFNLSFFAQIPTNGLVAYYPFNGNANDASGNGYDGTVHGATLTTDRFGHANSAYSFDGISNYIITEKQINWEDQGLNKNMSISLWVWANSLGKHNGTYYPGVAINNRDADMTGTYWYFGYGGYENNDQKAAFTFSNNHDFESKTTIEFGKWYHIAMTLSNGNTVKIYVDGNLETTETTTNFFNGNIRQNSDWEKWTTRRCIQ